MTMTTSIAETCLIWSFVMILFGIIVVLLSILDLYRRYVRLAKLVTRFHKPRVKRTVKKPGNVIKVYEWIPGDNDP